MIETVSLTARPGTAAELIALLPWEGDRSLVIDSGAVFVGFKKFQPGEVFGNHYHDAYDEFFVVVEGQMTIWRGRSTKTVLNAGSTLLCDRGSHHYLVNATATIATILYVKSSPTADDTIWVDWSPEETA